jgi:hypothetical protein
MIYTTPVCTVKNCRWWTEELSETCSVFFQKYAVPPWSCSQAVSKPVWYIPLLCVQWKTPDDGQRNCPKHVVLFQKYPVPSWSCSQAVSKPVWHIPLLCVQWKTADDGQRNPQEILPAHFC